MASFNRVILVGNLTRDPEVRYTPSGTAVCDIGIAVNERRKSSTGEWIEEVVYVDVTLWGRTAEVAGEYLTKGSPVLIEGRLRLDTWEKEGEKRSKLRVVADRMQMLGGRGAGNNVGTGGRAAAAGPGSGTPAPNVAPVEDFPPEDDVPF
ncbi:MAG: single-stranded DNA-binding protein [Thermogutta sp.]|uniref:single-stranded DNA-binding protein n=1 Tax=Thermogutta sp. TaxID=1962930 RepID=UPI00198B34B3|nr:single-stranded DNA-binding protein [Thermogutta sp.]MBC7352080.1 single-stranded DNA-binding protein [Thermogutta sp.]